MKLTNLVQDEDAVSPVIGVILMVAITVILAAVIGTFVLGLGGQVGNNAPSANIGYEYDSPHKTNQSVTANHNGGDPVEAKNLNLKIAGTGVWNSTDGLHPALNTSTDSTTSAWSGKITAGDSLTVQEDDDVNDLISDGDSVQLIWSSPDGGDTAILADDTVSL